MMPTFDSVRAAHCKIASAVLAVVMYIRQHSDMTSVGRAWSRKLSVTGRALMSRGIRL